MSPPVILTNNYDLHIETVHECSDRCSDTNECTHFTLYNEDGGCFLYSGVFRYVNDAQLSKNNQCGILIDRVGLHVVINLI
jgi:hypothetical protein